MTSTPKPSSPRRTLPKPAIRVRTSALGHRLGVERQADLTVLDRDGEHGQPLGSVEAVAAAQVVSAAVPAAAQLGALQRAELQRERAVTAVVGDGEKLPVDVGEQDAVSVD